MVCATATQKAKHKKWERERNIGNASARVINNEGANRWSDQKESNGERAEKLRAGCQAINLPAWTGENKKGGSDRGKKGFAQTVQWPPEDNTSTLAPRRTNEVSKIQGARRHRSKAKGLRFLVE